MQALKYVMLDNLREMVRLKQAAHDSLFKFSITKMFPFNLIAPQVDWQRITRMMKLLCEKCAEQKKFVAKEKPKAPEEDIPFLGIVPYYLDSLSETAAVLGKVAEYNQNKLERKIKGSYKEYNELIKEYQDSSDKTAEIGIIMHKAFTE